MDNPIVLFAVIGAVLGIIGGIYVMSKAGQRTKEHVGNKEQVMDELFNGSPQVTYQNPFGSGIPLTDLIAGAGKRGYKHTQTVRESGHMSTHVFERVTP